MDLRQAYETLGLARGATHAEIEAAYQRLCDDLSRRLERVSATPVKARFHELRSRLELARDTLLAEPQPADEPLSHAFGVLGLRPGASALDVAAAYVALCEEIEREARDAPTEDLRRACLEARADVDAAYQQCALSPLRSEPEPAGGERAARYETQMSATPFEAPSRRAASGGRRGHDVLAEVLRVEPGDDDDGPFAMVRPPPRRTLRRVLAGATTGLVFVVGAALGAGWWLGIDWVPALRDALPPQLAQRFAPSEPTVDLEEARLGAEYLRRRVAEERRVIEEQVRDSRAKEQQLAERQGGGSQAEADRVAIELERARARRALSEELADVAERHVFSSPELAQAYGKLELGTERMTGGSRADALAAFAEARTRLEASLRRLDLAEAAVGALSEAEASLEGWRSLAASADLAPHPASVEGQEMLESARATLREGRFEEARADLRRASQQFATALADGRRQLAAARAAAAAAQLAEMPSVEADAELAEVASPAEVQRPAAAEDAPKPEAAAVAPASETASELAAAVASDAAAAAADPALPDVAAATFNEERAAIKLVMVPAGEFYYGCNPEQGGDCDVEEAPGRRLALAAFQIDRTEVRVAEYRACVEAGACTPPARAEGCNATVPERGDHPMNCVDWRQANAYCAWVGKRLPSDREWEKAARGTDGRAYPWGNEPATCTRAAIADGEGIGCGRGSTWPVASFADGRSPFGLFDMAGNVLEWTADAARDGSADRVVRGGSWREGPPLARAWFREAFPSEIQDPRIGFRCAKDDALFASRGLR